MKLSAFIRVYPWLIISLPMAAQTLTVLPSSVNRSTPESRQQLIAEATVNNHQEDWTAKVKWSSSNPQVATVDANGLVKPVSDGDAVISAEGHASTRVHVANSKAPFAWSFRNHVIPVMTKVGCNQGACHGALAGKNGFNIHHPTRCRQALHSRVARIPHSLRMDRRGRATAQSERSRSDWP